MNTCYECGKELKFWEGYRHPGLGKKKLVCSKCFDTLEESIENYSKFISGYFKQEEQISDLNNSNIKLKFHKLV
jgi:hypothetical protein